MDECLMMSVEEAAAVFRVGRSTMYEEVRSGNIPALRIGRRWVVPISGIEEMVRAAIAQAEERRASSPSQS
jgi:excisionase family DNA binding protein